MKKVIIAFDGIHYSDGTFEFARRLNMLQPLFLTAVFVPQAQVLSSTDAGETRGGFIPLLEGTWSEVVERNIEDFEQQCKEHHIAYGVHRDFDDFPVPELERESVYADLLLVGTEMFYAGSEQDIPNAYLQKLLHDAKCPVILVPEKFSFPEQVVIGYDGSDESVFALKQFTYLLPEFSQLKTLIIRFSDNKNRSTRNEKELGELAARHFSDYSIETMDVKAEKMFNDWLAGQRSALFVCGSYGRSSFSRLIRKSFADPVIREYVLPIFISHL